MAIPLKCATQSYAWGKVGSSSQVALLTKASDPSFQLDENTPYAELWMGTHPNGPAVLENSPGTSLKEYIEKNPQVLGSKIPAKFGQRLPFLFKVLSVNKALSIQAHPNKKLAETLHKEFPTIYKDPNHKPEMAIAVTPFEGLCGFRPAKEIAKFFKDIEQLRDVIGPAKCAAFIQAQEGGRPMGGPLRECFHALMACDSATVAECLQSLVAEMKNRSQQDDIVELVLRLNTQFPGDVGCFCAFLLNHMRLQPGEAMFLQANLPHAYLSGDCMECMAASDNVVRAGLTPKFKDVETLCSMLEYECKWPQENLFDYEVTGPNTRLYNPPVPDFAVVRIEIAPGQSSCHVEAVDSPSLLIIVEGGLVISDKTHSQGSILFLPANTPLGNVTVAGNHGVLAFRALCVID